MSSAKIVNLRQHRKATRRATDQKQGDENAVKFGRTKAQRRVEEQDAARKAAHLDGHKLEE